MSTAPIANLGSLVSQAERLRARALQQMQGAPDAPVGEADRSSYAGLHTAARAACTVDGTMPLDGVEEPERLATVARLHRSAGLIEHELLQRLAEMRTTPGSADA